MGATQGTLQYLRGLVNFVRISCSIKSEINTLGAKHSLLYGSDNVSG